MYCPICLEKNVSNEILLLGKSCYICFDESCDLCLDVDQFKLLSQEKDQQKPTNEVALIDNTNDSKKVKSNEATNKLELLKSMQSVSTNASGKSDSKLSSECVIVLKRLEPVIFKSETKLNTDLNQFNYISNSKADIRKSAKLSKSNKRKTIEIPKPEIFDIKKKLKKSSKALAKKSDITNKQTPNRILNWLKLPIEMQMESKIVSMLLLHLNLCQTCPLVDRAKLEYQLCNSLANRFHQDVVFALSHSFVSHLLNMLQSISTETAPVTEIIDQRVVALLRRHFIHTDPSGSLKCEYFISAICDGCGRNSSQPMTSDHILTLPFDMTNFKMTKDKIRYNAHCTNCRKTRHSVFTEISISKLPQFLLLHCPNGVKSNIRRFETDIVVWRRQYPLMAVIECGHCPQYQAISTIYRPANIPTGRAHFRQKSICFVCICVFPADTDCIFTVALQKYQRRALIEVN